MKLEHIYKDMVGIIPAYTEMGNVTKVLFYGEKGDINSLLLPQHLESMKQKWARLYALDLRAQARQLQNKYNRSSPLPFYSPDGKAFVPFKLRKAKIVGDAIYGYVCLDIIAQIKPVSSRSTCTLILIDEQEIPIFSNVITAKLAFYLGKEVEQDCFYGTPNAEKELLTALHTLRRYFLQ